MNCRLILTSILFFSMVSGLYGQSYKKQPKRRFAATVVFGANFSQVEGDESSGFDKAGIVGGLRGTILFTKRHYLNIELLYSQRGSRLERQGAVFLGGQREFIKVDFVDVPILFQVFPKKTEGKTYFEVGPYFGRNIRTKIEEVVTDTTRFNRYGDHVSDFKKVEFGGIIGVGLRIKNKVGLGIRFGMALTPMFKNEDFEIENGKLGTLVPVYKLQNYYVSVFGAWHF